MQCTADSETKSTNIDKVALQIPHMMTLTNCPHFQRFRIKKTRTFEVGRRFIDIHTAGYMSAYHMRPHTVPTDVSTVFKLPFSFPFSFSRIKRAQKMSTFL